MAKSSAKPLPRWMSAKRDCREARFVQIGNSLLFHEKFRSLSAGAFKLYICCAMEAAGSINFQIPASKAEQYGIPPRSLARYIKELEGRGSFRPTAAENQPGQQMTIRSASAGWMMDDSLSLTTPTKEREQREDNTGQGIQRILFSRPIGPALVFFPLTPAFPGSKAAHFFRV